MRSELMKGNLDSLIIAIAADGALHGYGVVEELRARSGGLFDLPEGTVYPALHRLEKAGLLSSHREDVNGRERRVYRVTRKGLKALDERRNEWSTFARTVGAIIGSPA